MADNTPFPTKRTGFFIADYEGAAVFMPIRIRCRDKTRDIVKQNNINKLKRFWPVFQWRVIRTGNKNSVCYADQSNYCWDEGVRTMKPNTRACVGAAAGRLISGSGSSSVYDYSQSKHISVGGTVSEGNVQLYDYDRQCHFSGSGSGGSYNLYDYGNQAHVSLQINGNQFQGYDYDEQCHFSGSVNGNSVTLYDYGESQHFSYTV